MLDPAEIPGLLANPESHRVERTRSVSDSEKFCKAICAFANDLPASGLPGYLFIGVDKDGKASGATVDEALLEALASHRSNGQIIPMPMMQVFRTTHEGQPIAVVEVLPSDMPPVRYKSQAWVRVGPSARLATPEEERRLTEKRIDRARTWDLQACQDATLDDLVLELFTLAYLPQAVSRQIIQENHRAIEDQLGSLRFYHRRLGVPTNGAIIVFGKDIEAFFPAAYVQYVQYEGTTQASEVRRERRFSGDLGHIMRALDELAHDVESARPVRTDRLIDVTVATYPAPALHELLVNAVIHRNYDTSTTPVTVNHYEDRIEIQNPGSLYGDLTRDQFPTGTSYRNPVLAEAAKILGFANRFGRGIALAQAALEYNGSPRAEFVVGDNHMLVIVRRKP